MMRGRYLACVSAALWIAASAGAFAQSPGNETAQQNVRESRQYEQLVCSNAAFRAKRMAEECGPITDPQLHQSCVASFQCDRGAHAAHWRQAPPSEKIR